ncbi:(2Fe-2S)-binding protein [Bacillus sp. 31A1R]|uniref:(2Fe-2S)-binding protein n=1 Tax=Robertmurraya mangrovi TaxID=3098077 RepID=A0ABU5J2J7_9BACI|nr:(2Fe-2S)-binding protein [Bacillus sp. 31A1R]MDZ5473582.1 (2Fe-2S)-binding protein [Bacillus sp. 31A1R]
MKELKWDVMLETFYISNRNQQHNLMDFSLPELLTKEVSSEFLNIYGQGIKATNQNVTALYIAGWLGYLWGGLHYLYTHDRKIEVNDIRIQVYQKPKNKCWINFYFEEYKVAAHSDLGTEAEGFCRQYLTPIMTELADVTTESLLNLWHQVYHSLYWVEHRIKRVSISKELEESFLKGIEKLLKDTHPSLFNLKIHPFQKKLKFVDNPWDKSDPLPLKPSCCLAYQTEDQHKCYTCPRMKPEVREAKKLIILNRGV